MGRNWYCDQNCPISVPLYLLLRLHTQGRIVTVPAVTASSPPLIPLPGPLTVTISVSAVTVASAASVPAAAIWFSVKRELFGLDILDLVSQLHLHKCGRDLNGAMLP